MSVYAGYAKQWQPWYVFAGMIDNYAVVPPSVSEVIAATLPTLELLLGLAPITGVYRKTSSAAAVVMLLPFFALMVWAYARAMKIDCGCFGPDQSPGAAHYSPRRLARGSFRVAHASVVALGRKPSRRSGRAGGGNSDPRAGA